MKRLLCVLMVMVMAVLLVPTIAGANREHKDINYKVIYEPNGAGNVSGYMWIFKEQGTLETTYGLNWDLAATPATGYRFDKWIIRGVTYTAEKTSWGISITEDEYDSYSADGAEVYVFFKKDPSAEPDPEPVVVVEEKKPEEPHVHAEVWVEGTPATCTHTGLTDGSKCKWCGEVLKAQTEIPKIDHVYSMWVPNGSGKHFASCLYCGNKIDAECQKVQLPIKSSSGAAITLCPVCGDCSGATATTVKGLKVGEGAPYRGTLRVWNIDAGDGNKYLAVSFDRFGKIMQPEGEVSVTLPDDLKGTTAGVIGADGSVKTVQESNGTLKLDFTGSQVVVLKGN